MNRLARWLTFNLWYLGRPPWDTGVSPPELLAYLQAHPSGRALDLGCGTGVNVETLARAGWQVTGIDFALRAVASARRRVRRAGLPADVRLGDVTDLHDLSGRFDLIFDVGCYFGLPVTGKIAYRHNLRRLLAPGGEVLLYGYLQTAPGEFGMSEEDIQALAAQLELLSRVDSLDARGRRSTWLTFHNGASL